MIMHEHVWRTQSRHVTSDGDLSYQHCRCGQWRLLLGSDHVLATPNRRGDGRRVQATSLFRAARGRVT